MIPLNTRAWFQVLSDIARRALGRALLQLLRWLNPRAAGWAMAFIREEDIC